MSGFWSLTNRATSSPATATQSAPTGAGAAGQQLRLRSLQCALAGPGAGVDQLVVRDGASGVGAVIWTEDLSVGANGTASVNLGDLDIRASVGNALTVEFGSGVATDKESVNAQGDYVPVGWPLGQV